jgi:uncharacterized protein (TIGR00730 family)
MRTGRHVITVFGSATPVAGTPGYDLAYDLGVRLARAGFVVCNGGYGGIMEATAKGAINAGGSTIGIITTFYANRPANPWIREVIETGTPVERLLRLIGEADGFVILPGGTGTLLELAAVWEFMNKGIAATRPAILLGGFWHEVVSLVSGELIREGRAGPQLLREAGSPDECIHILNTLLKVNP